MRHVSTLRRASGAPSKRLGDGAGQLVGAEVELDELSALADGGGQCAAQPVVVEEEELEAAALEEALGNRPRELVDLEHEQLQLHAVAQR